MRPLNPVRPSDAFGPIIGKPRDDAIEGLDVEARAFLNAIVKRVVIEGALSDHGARNVSLSLKRDSQVDQKCSQRLFHPIIICGFFRTWQAESSASHSV